jgi:hypothetical protein
MRSELSKRITKLEGRGFAAAEIRLAYRNYMKHDILPKNRGLQEIVLNLHQCLAEMESSVPTAPPEVENAL